HKITNYQSPITNHPERPPVKREEVHDRSAEKGYYQLPITNHQLPIKISSPPALSVRRLRF
ncbi:MAG: hypothetical protein SPK97_05495, partial [Bacteroidales bacterium]|nr:hypothetical protein [Bacteroidales bacterium]